MEKQAARATSAIIAAVLSMLVLHMIPGSPAAPADVFGLVLWFVISIIVQAKPAFSTLGF